LLSPPVVENIKGFVPVKKIFAKKLSTFAFWITNPFLVTGGIGSPAKRGFVWASGNRTISGDIASPSCCWKHLFYKGFFLSAIYNKKAAMQIIQTAFIRIAYFNH